jgi:hypothetical protein
VRRSRLSGYAGDPVPPAGALLYAALGGTQTTSDLYLLDPADGSETVIGPIGFALTGLAFHPGTGVLYGVTSNNSAANPRSLITVNTTTGAGTLVGALGIASPVADCGFTNAGVLYGYRANTGTLYTINLLTGAATQASVYTIPFPASGTCMDFDDDNVLFVSPEGDDELYYNAVGPLFIPTAQIDLSGFAPGDGVINACSFTKPAQLWGIDVNSNGWFLIRINTLTGVITSLGQTLDWFDALAWDMRPTLAANYPFPPGLLPVKVVLDVTLVPSPRLARAPSSFPVLRPPQVVNTPPPPYIDKIRTRFAYTPRRLGRGGR